jgi:KipI family sensor histidine kinase inhibitor
MQYTRAMNFVDASDSSLLIVFGDVISPELNREVVALFHSLRDCGCGFIRDLHPAYASLLIDFDPLAASHCDVRSLVERVTSDSAHHQHGESRLVEIPVCYGGEFGPDLGDVARHCGVAEEAVIRSHVNAEYTVYFLGFAPGFAYMGGLPESIATPRLESPRKRVSAGSVGIAGAQTGVYGIDSPGGWRLIGRTPLTLFDAQITPPALLQPGDRVRFNAIGLDTYNRMVQR